MTMEGRRLGRSGIEVSPLGMGCWAIGGPAWRDGQPIGWGQIDDEESVRAVHAALDEGVSLFDTAQVYGCGHSERILGRALAGRRDEAVIATKFGFLFDPETRQATDQDASPEGIRRSCEESLQRLDTDRIDLFQFHVGDHDPEAAVEVRETLEGLVAEGKIRGYGWSTDSPERAEVFAGGPSCTAVQQHFNVFGGNDETLALCEREDLASLIRGPLAMGVLTGKFTQESSVPSDDVRSRWSFRDGPVADQLTALEGIREVLSSGGRTLAQGALCWLWARSDRTLPIPGFKSVDQVRENAGAMRFGPLEADAMREIDTLLGRAPTAS